MNLGKGAHIHAASAGGPRYDPDQTSEDRSSAERNGIWLCAVCADLIDKDPKRYPASLLHRWKAEAEVEARMALGKPAVPSKAQPQPAIELNVTSKLSSSEDSGLLHNYALKANFKNIGASRIDDWYIEIEVPTAVLLPDRKHYASTVHERSNKQTTLIRFTPPALHIEDSYAYNLPYRVTEPIYYANLQSNGATFSLPVQVRAYINGSLAASFEKPFAGNFENF